MLVIKDIEKKAKTFPEVVDSGNAIPTRLLAWMIMDIQAEDPNGKSNISREPLYDSLAWRKKICIGAYTIKEMQLKEASATSGEKTKM